MRDKTDDNGQQSDSLAVSDFYKQTAIEQVSEKLNSEVLQKAKDQAHGASHRALWWLRPAALAATLALSVALVLQVGDMGATKTVPYNPGPPAAATQNENVFDDAAAAGIEQIREAESAARVNPGSSDASIAPANQVGRDPVPGRSATENQGCSADQRASSGTWWQCIQTLERRGLSDLARSELEALFAADPGFDVPD